MPRHLIVFCKNPRLGSVKTRIAATAGDESALDIYVKLLHLTKDAVDALVDVTIHVFYDAYIDYHDLWPGVSPYEKHLQVGTDLGERMALAFKHIYEIDSSAQVLIIGSDCATLTTDDLYDAFDMLTQKDLVLGPSDDGGYYLLGMGQYVDNLFANIEYSTPTVLKNTIQRIEKCNKSYSLLRPQTDIDTFDQWEQHIALPKTDDI